MAWLDFRFGHQRRRPPSLLEAIAGSIIPLLIIFCSQPLVLFGILGLPTSWLDVITMDLDLFNILREEGPLGMFRVLWKIGRPCLPGHRPNWMNEMFPITAAALTSAIKAQVYHDVDNAPINPQATFVYVNGICTTARMARNAGHELSRMMNEHITVVHNPTNSALVDLLECAVGKLWIGRNWVVAKPVALVYEELLRALRDENKTKVVLIAHSEGTIVASDVLWLLWETVDSMELPEGAMRKLEIYNLANASHWMKQRNRAPYIENISNQRDNVGLLGANAPAKAKKAWDIDVAGKMVYPNSIRWGHQMQAHYLKYLKKGDYPDSKLHEYGIKR